MMMFTEHLKIQNLVRLSPDQTGLPQFSMPVFSEISFTISALVIFTNYLKSINCILKWAAKIVLKLRTENFF
jgi:hypothetical protein